MTEDDKLRDYLKRVTGDLRKVRRRLLEVEGRGHEPIAIVGMSCRYPGAVSSPEDLWNLTISGGDGMSPFPTDRGWDLEELHGDGDRPGTSYALEGGFVHDADKFDAQFFGVSPRESMAMDPQQRLLLEGAWEAIEDGGIDPVSLKGSQTGVFAGISSSYYGVGLSGSASGDIEDYGLTGATCSVASGRLSYVFGLEGPAVSVDTACSSSLVALHLACQALRAGECSMALAGGVVVMARPGILVEFTRQRGLSRDGRCKSFAQAADGTGFAEGMGVLLLERLSDALRNGREVLGVVRGSAVNQDGASNGLTAPNGPSQQRVIAQALAGAGLSARQIDVVEGHGTGTTLGDPIEAQALLATYGRAREEGRPLWLGSVKSNIGHTQAAAGVAGVIKMVMAMRHGVLPRTLHVDEPSSKVDWSVGGVELLTCERPWERGSEPRRAGVSSFGISGTNAHVIIEEASQAETFSFSSSSSSSSSSSVEADVERGGPGARDEGGDALGEALVSVPETLLGAGVLPFSLAAKSESALRAQAIRLREHLMAAPELEMDDVAFSLAGRTAFEHRAVLLGGEREELSDALSEFAGGDLGNGRVVTGAVPVGGTGATAFLFSGQGAQHAGMGRELYGVFPVFKGALDAVCAVLDEHLDRPLQQVMFASAGSAEAALLDRTLYTQTSLFALEVAMFRLLEHLGVRPDFVMGHSIGELVAAHVAGVFSLRDACALVAARGRLMEDLPEGGAMVAIRATEQVVSATLAGYEDRVAIAAINGPDSIVISGEEEAVLEVERVHREGDRKTKRLQVSHAFHSQRMDGMLAEFGEVARHIDFNAPQIPIVSNLTGGMLSEEQVRDAQYWVRHVREAVRFADGARRLAHNGVNLFVELGPDGALSAMVQDCLEGSEDVERGDTDTTALALMRANQAEPRALLGALASIWVRGASVDWMKIHERSNAKRIPLPTYAFQRERYWLSTGPSAGDMATAGQSSTAHPLLGAVLALADDRGWLFTGRISLESHPWLADHAVMGRALLPGTAFLELALHAGAECGCPAIVELTLEAPLILPEQGAVALQLSVGEPTEDGRRSLAIHSRIQGASGQGAIEEESWTLHAGGALAAEAGSAADGRATAERADALLGRSWPPAGAEIVNLDGFYDLLSEMGLEYGPVFRGLRRAWKQGGEVLAEVALPDDHLLEAGAFGLQPALLDAALHAGGLGLAGSGGVEGAPGEVRLPFSWSGVELHARGAGALRVCLSKTSVDEVSLLAVDESGGLVLTVDALVSRGLSAEQLSAVGGARGQQLLGMDWAVLPSDAQASSAELVLLADAGSTLGSSLSAAGHSVAVHPDLASLRERIGEGDGEVPGSVLVDCTRVCEDVVAGMHDGVKRALALLQDFSSQKPFAESRLVLVTRGAVAVGVAEDLHGISQAPIWGLVRSAQAENPERFVLVDIDGHEASMAGLSGALATGEAQLALREGSVCAPRLTRAAAPAPGSTDRRIADGEDVVARREGDASAPTQVGVESRGTILITGGTGALGMLVARHLVVEHGVARLLLASRRGGEAQGAGELQTELEALGAEVRIEACDVSDREELARLVRSVADEGHRLQGVIHTAGVLDDGVIGSLTAERMDGVLGPKADAAWHLHELTRHLDLNAFVLFSSVAGAIGSPGQGNYAAANAFLDALAAHRRALGLAGVSIAWGPWAGEEGMAGNLGEADRARLTRSGMDALSVEQGLELFDAALTTEEALAVAVPVDFSTLRSRAGTGMLPALFGGLVRVPVRRAGEAGESLARRLVDVPEVERESVVLEMVRGQVASVLGHASPLDVDPGRAFKDLGFDSLAAVELRNRLNAVTGMRLPATLVFDYPTTLAVAGHLLKEVSDTGPGVVGSSIVVSGGAPDEPVAIVGMSCRYPGGVYSPQELWGLVSSGGDGISSFPSDRGWDLGRLYDPDPEHAGTSYTREGGFLYDAGDFDTEFFDIGPREALAMDPQQRLLLEGAWEALEDAGIDPISLRGSQTGVFAGLMYHEYGAASGESSSTDFENYGLTGNAGSVLSGRVSYTFGLEGPAITVDTACSSSLVALHWACQALRTGECSMALAGGVTVMASPMTFVGFSRQRGLAVDGRCKSFAQAADGVGWSEGMGVLLLERLSDAVRNGREVLGVVRGSAVNQDGASNGLTAPNGPSQQRVISRALAGAGLSAGQVDVVDGHGTGTTLGDPIEAQALIATYGQARSEDRPLWLGSVKSNIGHTQAAAGVAGVIKMVMAMRHGVLPRTLHVDEPSSNVDWSDGGVELLTRERAWERNGEPRRAGVSSFGISGTNAHVILEEAPPSQAPSSLPSPRLPRQTRAILLTLSARSGTALRAQAERLHRHLTASPDLKMGDVALSLTGRSVFGHRAVVLGDEREVLLSGLSALAGEASSSTGVIAGDAAPAKAGALAFMFTGQGAQRVGMGRELYDAFPVFRQALQEVCAELDKHLERPLLDLLFAPDDEAGAIDRTLYTQTGLLALETALFRLLEHLGLRPDFVMGHSIGELVAAHVAGVFSLADACALVAARGRLMEELPEGGAMVSIQATEQELAGALGEYEGSVDLAAINGRDSVVISGEEDAVLAIAAAYRERDRKTKRLQVSHAFHSQRMDGMLAAFEEVARGIAFSAPRIPIVSNLTGGPVSAEQVCDPAYWVAHARRPVRFADGARWLQGHGVKAFLEVGPDGVLTALAQDAIDTPQDGPVDLSESTRPVTVSLLRRDRPEIHTLLGALASIWVAGTALDWSRLHDGTDAKRAALPTYAFQRRRFWPRTAPGAGDMVAAGQARANHPLLGAALALADDRGSVFTGRISLESHPWLADHAVMGRVLLPGTAFLELALHAGAQLGCPAVAELTLETPLVLPDRGAVQIQIVVGEPEESGARSLSIHSRPAAAPSEDGLLGGEWTRHAGGVLALEGMVSNGRADALGEHAKSLAADAWPPPGARAIDLDGLYYALAEWGLEYGPAFQGLQAVWRRGEELFAEVALPVQQREDALAFGMHPALLDAAFHAGLSTRIADSAAGESSAEGVSLPFAFNGVELHRTGASSLRVSLSPGEDGAISLLAADAAGGLVAFVDSLAVREMSSEQLGAGRDAHRDSLFTVSWSEISLPAEDLPSSPDPSAEVSSEPGARPRSSTAPGGLVLLGAEDSPLAQSLRAIGVPVMVRSGLGDLGEIAGTASLPRTVLVDCGPGGVPALTPGTGESSHERGVSDQLLPSVHGNARQALSLMQSWISEERFSSARLAFVTGDAVATSGQEEVSGLALSPLWGLVRSAQSEHPERFVLLDIDGEETSLALLPAALAGGESQLAIRRGAVLAPRLVRAHPAPAETPDDAMFDPEGVVLITGGTGALGALVARHLVVEHGVGHLLLVSRRGERAQGAAVLRTELQALGAEVGIAACDVSDRADLAKLLDSLAEGGRPLKGVVHTAGVLDDGVIGSLTAERIEGVLGPKADAAWHLHELTQHLDLSAFVLFSSAAAAFGSPGQGNYAAANAFLDALAAHRRAIGLPGSSLAWGLWEQTAGMAGDLSEADVARMARSGVRVIAPGAGLELFDRALSADEALMLPIPLDVQVLRAHARMGTLPAFFGALAPAPPRKSGDGGGSLARRLTETPEAEREGVVLELVRAEVATVLGHASAQTIDTQRTFKELGFDSLAAVEFRNRLNAVTGMRLPATLVFDYPTTAAVAANVLREMSGASLNVLSAPAATGVLDEPIAIVGMSCRYPGGVNSPEDLWKLVLEGVDAIAGLPTDRGWDLERLYDPDPDHPGTSYAREGGYLHDAGRFDAGFFKIGPREALAMDPQQRLLLEVSWEALEHAGIDPLSLRGSQTGVFSGLIYHDYGVGAGGMASGEFESYGMTGGAGSVASGRVSYTFGFEGPAVTVDTACSSSLVALHLASQALRSGECSLALAGGATVMASPAAIVGFSRQRVLSPDGRCKSFADSADGTGWSEGVGMLLLERLSDAERNGHEVFGVVRGSAVNQDGASNGLTAPNGPSQQRVIAQALANARISPDQVDAVEAHGTGTTLGDPIEAQALIATYGQDRAEEHPLWLGSVKSNFGHTQAAAGVAGVIKMVMAMRHRVLPKTLHVDRPSSHVDWSEGEIVLLTEARPWANGRGPRRAGVSSFGVSGTNAHVIVEEAPTAAVGPGDSRGEADDGRGAEEDLTGEHRPIATHFSPLLLSAKSEEALCAQARRLGEHLTDRPELEPADVGRSLALRTVFEHRAVVVGGEREALLTGLSTVAAGERAAGMTRGVSSSAGDGGAVFVFPGQGSQWPGMALELLDCSPVFAARMRACAEALSEYVDWSVEDVLRGAESAPGLERIDVLQPVLFAVVVSLAGLWQSFGARPNAVVGHSQGEIAAAYIAGGLSLQDASRVVALRSRLLLKLVGRGAIVSVALGLEELGPRLERWGDRITVSAMNGPSSVGVAGEPEVLAELLQALQAEGVRARAVAATVATHSPQAEIVREELLEALAPVTPRSGEVPFFSTVTGRLLDTAELNGEYWYRNMREPVRFAQVTRALLEEGQRAFIEMSPHPVLTVGVQESVDEFVDDPEEVLVTGTLRREQGGAERFLTSLGAAWAHGVGVDWDGLLAGSGARRLALPTYPFQREQYWLLPTAAAGDATSIGLSAADHPLLGAEVAMAGARGWLFTGRLSLGSHPWLTQYRVMDTAMLPGTGFVELALAAGERVGAEIVEELTLERPLSLDGEGAVHIQVSVSAPDDEGKRAIAVHARPEGASAEESDGEEWTRHASGVLGGGGDHHRGGGEGSREEAHIQSQTGEAWPPAGAEELDTEILYERLADAGYDYGPIFQGLRRAWRTEGRLCGEVEMDFEQDVDADGFHTHPALFEAMLHLALLGGSDETGDGEYPTAVAFSGVRSFANAAGMLRVSIADAGDGDGVRLIAVEEDGSPVLSARAVQMKALERSRWKRAAHGGQGALYGLRWVEHRTGSGSSRLRVAMLGEDTRMSAALLGAHAAEQPDRHADLRALETALADGAPAPELVVVEARAVGGLSPTRAETAADAGFAGLVHQATVRTLELLQAWIASEALAEARLVLLTEAAFAAAPGDAPNLVQAALIGLIRSAQAEHPGRFGVLDLDGARAPAGLSYGELLGDEPELSLRAGSLYAPRLVPLKTEDRPAPATLHPDGTVLITDGTGPLGGLVARHLVAECGVRRLLLLSPRGSRTDRENELVPELEEQGCDVRVAACDPSDREALGELLASISEDHPLSLAVHAADALDDGVIESLDGERLARVMGPKADVALNLHALVEQAELILFSSAAAAIGSPGQGNHAAASSFLDALAYDRRAQGLPGVSLAWGMWEQTGVSAGEDRSAEERMRAQRRIISSLTLEQGLELFDLARGAGEALLAPMHLDTAALRLRARTGMLPAALRGLVRAPARRASAVRDTLASRLARAPEAERDGVVLEFVRGHVAGVLGHAAPDAIDPSRSFKDAGFDSLAAVEFRNRLSEASGLKLASTLVFDRPTPLAVAELLRAKLTEAGTATGTEAGTIDEEIDRLERMLLASGEEGDERERIGGRLRALLAKLADGGASEEGAVTVEMIESASAEELVELIELDLAES